MGFVLRLQPVDPKAWGILHLHSMGWGGLEQISDCWYPLVPLASTLGPSGVCMSQTEGTLFPWVRLAPEPQSPCAAVGWLRDISCKSLRSLSPGVPTLILQRSSPVAADPGASEGMGKGLQKDLCLLWSKGSPSPSPPIGHPNRAKGFQLRRDKCHLIINWKSLLHGENSQQRGKTNGNAEVYADLPPPTVFLFPGSDGTG